MLIPLGGYAGGGSTSLREIGGITCGGVFVGALVVGIVGAYGVACIFIAGLLGNVGLFPFVFFGAGVPLLVFFGGPVRDVAECAADRARREEKS